jgi:aerobic-type carbon monoxide dehydrogenase small subunit (CoxS/CutS family)
MARVTELIVNGASRAIDADAESSLLNVLREQLDLTGSKYSCGEGQCGACTVLINGLPRKSCITPVGAVGKKAVTTIEGLEKNGQLHPVQQAFLDLDAFQCAFCTSGMIMTGVALLQSNPHPSEAEAAQFFDSNICRCGTYSRIIEAVRRAGTPEKGAGR